ncbi:MAG: murein peptide amidase A, partial [Variovorax sp.]|nr:murein peptide amidase A [Variovorax sp.]
MLAFMVGLAHSAPTCRDFAEKLPNTSQALCESAQLIPSGAKSVKGQTLWMRDIAPPDAKLRVLVVGGIHGDELSSSAVALHWIGLAGELIP